MTKQKLIEIIWRTLAGGPPIDPYSMKTKAEQIADAIEAEGGKER